MDDGPEDLLRGALKIRQPECKDGLRVNLDTILLASFTKPRGNERILEIGCAHGAVSLILAKRGFSVEGVDIQPHLIELASWNARYNGLEDRARFYVGNLREYKKLWRSQVFDRVVVNPPYYEDSSHRSHSDALAAALHGTECTLEDVIAASRYLLKNKGALDVVIRANRCGELFSLLDKYSTPPKIMRSVHPKPNANATVILIEAMRAARHGLIVEPPLFVVGSDGKETADLLAAYRL